MIADPTDDSDAVWRALANPVRRRILDLLAEGPGTTGDLAEAFPELSRFAVMQHLKVLEEAELVVPRREGRHRFNHLNAVPIQRIYRRWVSRYTGRWADALVALKEELEEPDDEPSSDPSATVA
ncbi:MAG: transcriptional regulator [Gemmatimonadota bacterium]